MNTCYNPFSLEGKTILVTGASSGIGRATAIECSKMGASVIITARNQERLEKTLSMMQGDTHIARTLDVLDADSMAEFVNWLPALDGMVLCAGISVLTTAQFATPAKFQKVFQTNFFATVELTRLILKNKKISNGSSIVAIASIAGHSHYSYGNSMYGASKAALSSWMKFLAKELAIKNIRVNCICPGMVKTPLTAPGSLTQEQLEADEARYPLKRYGKPEEIAYACVYYLSDASSWVTGTNFVIDGGVTI